MEVAMPMVGNAIDSYEDMFKEITRKLYGEDGLPECVQTERLSNPQDRGLTSIDYDIEGPLLKSEEHITAFGLAALMQNGLQSASILNPPFQQHKPNPSYEDKWIISEDNLQWTHSKIASYNPAQKLFRCAECDCVGYLPRVAEHWLGTHSNLRVFQCPQCPYESAWARCVRMHLTRHHNVSAEETTEALLKNNPVLHEVTRYLQRLKSRLEVNCAKPQTHQPEEFQQNTNPISTSTRSIPTQVTTATATESTNTSPTKRYSCTYCPYATDRRDLFTRHENIHREEKPFQCYVCQKQFNRADHVKKHFLRMHREHPYDLNRIRRHPPKNASGMSYYHKYNASETPTQSPEPINTDLSLMTNCLSIPNNFNNVPRAINGNRSDVKSANTKPNLLGKGSNKKKGEKRFTCCYCSWSGVDNWCLKRHMNTHLKPFVCGLCDYKAARSERLATHVLKVHNKRACGKCTFLADDAVQLATHQEEQHPLDQRNNRSSSSVLRTTTFNNTPTSQPTPFNQNPSNIKYEVSTTTAILQHGNRLLQNESKPWKPHIPKQHGAARLFNYMEASDSSEPECDSRGTEDMNRIILNHRIQSDFPEAGDVGNQIEEAEAEDDELPLFVCQTCGCEFEDDASLETHQYIRCHSTTSPAKTEEAKENVNPNPKYQCCLCEMAFNSQIEIMDHMPVHSIISYQFNGSCVQDKEGHGKRSRKQSSPKKIVLPFLCNEGLDVLWNPNSKMWRQGNNLHDKYMVQLVTKKGFSCNWCRNQRLSQFRTKGSLVLHQLWKHSNKAHFQCEHCNFCFRHRYQVILHSSRVHVTRPHLKSTPEKTQAVPSKETLHTTVPVLEEPSPNFFTHTFITSVPDISNASTNVHKLGMSFFEHSFLHTNASINSHMPLIIPTFPPN
ncbi:hypothetical protein PPYR_05789 [Photinus pyralis]|uniref:C2H2-type domain-containing protein n=4 Tax=Photinus pyralis TaxID=7054 RepID=A0A5N4AVN6_PHOPY|nr:zinc finger protein 429 [Photinus pyralis]XP_031336973.1 zinc finger protein 429 [Photinus pyralis]XP_031336974.1 zinc finger protein 429 [Photinus pyralis]KAB0801435.1 hypothetical protein PPYR_05789 [Photinus pyralis]